MNELNQPTRSVTRVTISTSRWTKARRALARRDLLVALVVAATLAASSGAAAAQAPGTASAAIPRALSRKVIEAYGGAAALAKVKAVRQTGKVTALAQGSKTGTLERLLAPPDSLRVQIGYPGEPPELRIHHAGRGVRDGQDVTGTIPHLAMVLQSARLALPLWIAAGDHDIRYGGRRERESRELETVVVALPGGLEVTGEIDPGSGRIVRTIGTIPGPGGASLEFVNTYSDFRKAGGITFAHREENFARGVHTGDTVLERIEVLSKVPEGAFDDAPRPTATATPGTAL